MPSKIISSHLKPAAKLQGNANEAQFLLNYFPLLSIGLIPFEDAIYKLILNTIDMVAKINSSIFDTNSIEEMDNAIQENRSQYMNLFDKRLKPKDHHMVHYELAIKDNGPLLREHRYKQ